MRPGSNSVEDHPQLTRNGHPVDGALVGAGSIMAHGMHHPRSIACILSRNLHDHLPSCSSFRHKCKESNGLILPWLRFASKSLLQFFIKVSSLVGLVAKLLLPSISSHTCIGFCGSMQQQEYSSSNCHIQFTSHIIMFFMWNLVCLKHQNLGSMSLKALVVSWIFDLE